MFMVRPSPIHGMGLFATQDLPAGFQLAVYHGIEMSLKSFHEQYGRDYRHTYSLRRLNRILCGKGVDNPSHWCNESLEPNVVLKKRGLWTLREIEAGEELTLRYPANYPRDYMVEDRRCHIE